MIDKIKNYFGDGKKLGLNIKYLIEKKELGTAGCLALLPKTINKNIVVVNGDVISEVSYKKIIEL